VHSAKGIQRRSFPRSGPPSCIPVDRWPFGDPPQVIPRRPWTTDAGRTSPSHAPNASSTVVQQGCIGRASSSAVEQSTGRAATMPWDLRHSDRSQAVAIGTVCQAASTILCCRCAGRLSDLRIQCHSETVESVDLPRRVSVSAGIRSVMGGHGIGHMWFSKDFHSIGSTGPHIRASVTLLATSSSNRMELSMDGIRSRTSDCVFENVVVVINQSTH